MIEMLQVKYATPHDFDDKKTNNIEVWSMSYRPFRMNVFLIEKKVGFHRFFPEEIQVSNSIFSKLRLSFIQNHFTECYSKVNCTIKAHKMSVNISLNGPVAMFYRHICWLRNQSNETWYDVKAVQTCIRLADRSSNIKYSLWPYFRWID